MNDTIDFYASNSLGTLWELSSINTDSPLFYAILITITLFFALVLYLYTGSFIVTVVIIQLLMGLLWFLDFIPFWIFIMTSAMSFIYIAYSFYIVSPEPENNTEAKPDYWDNYADNLKNAYTAKFGGNNLGFNDEVDKRIAVMKHCKRGFTHTLSRDWLKRMNKFTEAK